MDGPALPVAHSGVAEHDPVLLGLDAEGWVYVGLTIFFLIAIFVGKAPKRITDALDLRIAETRRRLDEAKAIRTEAEGLLAEAKRQQTAAASDAENIVAHARVEAGQLLAKAQTDAATLVERRSKMAEDRIGAAERAAVAEVRASAASAAVTAATALIERNDDASADKALVDKAIARLN